MFRDMGGAVSRYGRGCVGGWEDKNFEIWKVLFQDMTYAVSRYERCCFEIWEVLFRNMGGAKFVGLRRGHYCSEKDCWPNG